LLHNATSIQQWGHHQAKSKNWRNETNISTAT
jgi:hypothetical protein